MSDGQSEACREYLEDQASSDLSRVAVPPTELEVATLIYGLERTVRKLAFQRDRLLFAVTAACELADTGSKRHKVTFDQFGMGEIPTGWRVAEKMREVLLEANV